MFGNNSCGSGCMWIIILIILICCCGCGNGNSGCYNNCGWGGCC